MRNVIYEYTLDQAIADGVLIELFQSRWPELTGGKPLVATSHIMAEFSLGALQEIWDEYELSAATADPKAQREEVFTTHMNGFKVWVIEDPQAFTILFPEDY